MSSGRTRVEVEALLPDVATGVRAAIATVVPLSLSLVHARPELAWMALGGWLGTLTDPGGARGTRARVLIAFAAIGALEIALGGLARSVMAAVVFVSAVAFAATLLRALGAAASTLGTLLALVAALAATGHSDTALRDALFFALGSASALFLSTIIWPIAPHLPMRRAVGEVFAALGRYVEAIESCVAAGVPEDDERWVALARLHAREVRDAIDAARATSIALRARRAGESRVGSNLRVLLGMAESQFLLLVALASRVEVEGAAASRPLSSLARNYREIRACVVAPLAARASRDAEPASAVDELTTESELARSLAGDLDRTTAPEAPSWFALSLDRRLLLDALSPRSPLLHHATRVAAAAAVATLFGAAFSPLHAAWVTLTALVVLQPYTGATVRRAAERVVGTVFGALVAIAVTSARPSAVVLAAIMFPLSVAAVVTRPRSYRLFTLFLTPIFVLVATHTPGDAWVAAARAGDTVAGGVIALLASMLVFPRWEERVGLPQALAEMRRATEAYAAVVVETLAARDALALRRVDDARLLAAAAIGRAEVSLEQVLADPLRDRAHPPKVELVTYARRLALATTTLDALLSRRADGALVGGARARLARFATLLRDSSERD